MKNLLRVQIIVFGMMSYGVWGANLYVGNQTLVHYYDCKNGCWTTSKCVNTQNYVLKNTNPTELTTAILMSHLLQIQATDRLREVMRLILAQDDNRGSGHNNASNSSADYMENKVNDIPQVCLDLKNHIFYHGHLGYFPLVKPNDLLEDMVNTTSKRGIFRISNDIVSRLNLQVITSTGEYACMYLHLLPTIQPTIVGFAVDPLYEYVQYLPTLSFATNLLLGVLFTSINIQQVNINLDPNNNNKIIMEFLWTGGNIPYSTQPNVAIGVTELGPTTKIRAIIEVHYGTIKISSIYPIANQVHH